MRNLLSEVAVHHDIVWQAEVSFERSIFDSGAFELVFFECKLLEQFERLEVYFVDVGVNEFSDVG